MKSNAMKNIVANLRQMGCVLHDMPALEFFAREGDWQTVDYMHDVASLEAWEIDPQFEASLRKNLPGALIRICDSYHAAKDPINHHKYKFIVFDNPQGCFGANGEWCEHFEALPLVPNLMAGSGIVIFNVNWAPFNFESQKKWQNARSQFYGIPDTSRLSADFIKSFYKSFFEDKGAKVDFVFTEPRDPSYLSYAVCGISLC